MRSKTKKAFTLVEMMAVVVIIGILAAVIAPKFFGQVDKANKTRVLQDIESIEKAVTLYKFDTNEFPEDLRDLVKNPGENPNWNGPYLDKVPEDPWGNEYQYVAPGGEDREFDVWSYGRDGTDGGEGTDADITSWDSES
jgi:general secretion pathway protein G